MANTAANVEQMPPIASPFAHFFRVRANSSFSFANADSAVLSSISAIMPSKGLNTHEIIIKKYEDLICVECNRASLIDVFVSDD